MKYLFLSAFLLTGFLHLCASYADDAEKRKKTKPFLLAFLLLFYLHAADHPVLFLVLALLTSWLGDILLMPKGHHCFVMGGISFMLSHVFFIFVFIGHIALHKIEWIMLIPVVLAYFTIAHKVITAVKENTPKKMLVPMAFYLLCNSVMNVFALMLVLSIEKPGALIAYIGAVLFYVSDCSLFLVRYYPKPGVVYKKHFTVMLTYLLGELFIVTGMLLLRG